MALQISKKDNTNFITNTGFDLGQVLICWVKAELINSEKIRAISLFYKDIQIAEQSAINEINTIIVNGMDPISKAFDLSEGETQDLTTAQAKLKTAYEDTELYNVTII